MRDNDVGNSARKSKIKNDQKKEENDFDHFKWESPKTRKPRVYSVQLARVLYYNSLLKRFLIA